MFRLILEAVVAEINWSSEIFHHLFLAAGLGGIMAIGRKMGHNRAEVDPLTGELVARPHFMIKLIALSCLLASVATMVALYFIHDEKNAVPIALGMTGGFLLLGSLLLIGVYKIQVRVSETAITYIGPFGGKRVMPFDQIVEVKFWKQEYVFVDTRHKKISISIMSPDKPTLFMEGTDTGRPAIARR